MAHGAGVRDYLRTFDIELAAIGGTRVCGGTYKSTAYTRANLTAGDTMAQDLKDVVGSSHRITDGQTDNI